MGTRGCALPRAARGAQPAGARATGTSPRPLAEPCVRPCSALGARPGLGTSPPVGRSLVKPWRLPLRLPCSWVWVAKYTRYSRPPTAKALFLPEKPSRLSQTYSYWHRRLRLSWLEGRGPPASGCCFPKRGLGAVPPGGGSVPSEGVPIHPAVYEDKGHYPLRIRPCDRCRVRL